MVTEDYSHYHLDSSSDFLTQWDVYIWQEETLSILDRQDSLWTYDQRNRQLDFRGMVEHMGRQLISNCHLYCLECMIVVRFRVHALKDCPMLAILAHYFDHQHSLRIVTDMQKLVITSNDCNNTRKEFSI